MSSDADRWGARPSPVVEPAVAAQFLAERFGVTGTLTALGSQQDLNFRIDAETGERYVLKISNPAEEAEQLRVQHRAIARVAAVEQSLRLPAIVATLDGDDVAPLEHDGTTCAVRLLRYVEGAPIMDSRYLAPAVVGRLGELAGRVVRALRTGDDPVPGDLSPQWDLRRAVEVIADLAPFVDDLALRAEILAAAARASALLQPLVSSLPLQVIHGDLTDNNVVCDRATDGRLMPVGVIDFGDVMRSWAVAELAVTCTSVLHHRDATPASIIPAVRAFHGIRPLGTAELDALWPLIVLRTCVLVVSGYRQLALEDNSYAADGLQREVAMFAVATSAPPEVVGAAVRAAVLGTADVAPVVPTAPLVRATDGASATVLDLSVAQDDLAGGRWLAADAEDVAFSSAIANGASAAIARWGEARLTRARIDRASSTPTIALGAEVALGAATTVQAPWDGAVGLVDGGCALTAADRPRLILRGLAGAPATGELRAGDPIGSAGGTGAPRLEVQLTTLVGVPPMFVAPELADGWRAVCPDPAALLGIAPPATPGDPGASLLARRDQAFAPVQGHYFADPPQIERGWRHHLVDTDGQTYVDSLNNVTLLGHGHVGLSDAVHRQWLRLNTNSRFHYASVVELSERLAALLPPALDTVFLVNSGSEADDLALRLAWAFTGRRDVLAVGEAYHGWTDATDAVSTSIQDNPGAIGTRPGWVHVLDAPNTYRGRHRGDDAGHYADDAVAQIEELAARGRPPAAFLCEPYYGNAGGIPLPDRYLERVYAAVRAAGGLCIADEVQVGYGRLGAWFWGFEQQGVVPDIVAVAKGMGNGHPLGAVVTTREIAEGFRSQGYFFSSAGGSPVGAVVGLTVLDALRDEHLQENALVVGAHLRSRLLELQERHPIIGAVHGTGLYLGVELVRDRATLEPATEETAAICERLLGLGVIAQPTSDRMCVLKVKPPLCFTRESADVFADALDTVLTHGW